MSGNQSEDLSAMVDGELSASETRFLTRRLSHDKQLAASWERYHLARAALHQRASPQVQNLSERVAQALVGEAQAGRPGVGAKMAGWLKPAVGLAIAAAVGMSAFRYLQVDEAQPPVFVDNSATVGKPVRTDARFASGEVEVWSDPRVRGYVLRHNAVAAPRRAQGLSSIPYVYAIRPPQQSSEGEADKQISVDE